MRVELSTLKPNPYRDFKVDPIDEQAVEALAESIRDDGFWGGIVCRKTKSGIEIGAGHHRVAAAQRAGITRADVFVGNFTDEVMVRVYARENATQRGNTSTAIAGSVAALIRLRVLESFRQNPGGSARKPYGDGFGRDALLKELSDHVPGLNEHVVKQQLANLKASGDYDRIIDEVVLEFEALYREEFERVQRERELAEQEARETTDETERKEAQRRAKATEQHFLNTKKVGENLTQTKNRKKVDPTFDYAGVAKHLKKADHIETFRTLVTPQEVREKYLPLEGQAALAEEMVRRQGNNLSAATIRQEFNAMLNRMRGYSREVENKEKAADWEAEAKSLQETFVKHCRGMIATAKKLADHAEERPRGVMFYTTTEFREAVKHAERAVALLKEEGVV